MKHLPTVIVAVSLAACFGYWAYAIIPVAWEQATGMPRALSIAEDEINRLGINARYHDSWDCGDRRYRVTYFTDDEKIDVMVEDGQPTVSRMENLWKGKIKGPASR